MDSYLTASKAYVVKLVREEGQQVLEAKAKQAAKEAIDKFEQEWTPLMEAVKEAAETFDNLEGECCACVVSFTAFSERRLRHPCDIAGTLERKCKHFLVP